MDPTTHRDVKVEGHRLRQERGVRQVKRQIQSLPADAHVRVLGVCRRRVHPVELVGGREQLKVLQVEPELPRVRHEVDQVGWGLGRPVVQKVLKDNS